MDRNERMKDMGIGKVKMCFFILFFFVFILAGCSESEKGKTVEHNTANRVGDEWETLTIQDIRESAKEKTWKSDEESYEIPSDFALGYTSLSDAEKIWYEDINEMLAYATEEMVKLSEEGTKQGLSEEHIDKIYNCVMMDHPEYFYVEGYEYTIYEMGKNVVGIRLKGQYSLDKEERKARRQEIKTIVSEILREAPNSDDDYDKIKYVYEYIILNTEYSADAPDNQNIYSVLAGGESVCQGYAKTAQYLLKCMDIPCTLVYGKVHDGEFHSWNLVKSNDEYYHMDVTWGDASYSRNGQLVNDENTPDISYDYLCITTEQIMNTHQVEMIVEIPVCDALLDNYYVREECYCYGYDEEQIAREFEEGIQEGKQSITFKCDSESVYQELKCELIEKQRVFEYLDEALSKVSYIDNSEQLTLSFWVTN